jgi:hypothetical protein
MTSALDGVSGQRHGPAALYPREKDPRYPLYRRLGGPPEPVWTQRLEEKSFDSAGDRTSIAQSSSPQQTVRSDWATPWVGVTDPKGAVDHKSKTVGLHYLMNVKWMLLITQIFCRVYVRRNWMTGPSRFDPWQRRKNFSSWTLLFHSAICRMSERV